MPNIKVVDNEEVVDRHDGSESNQHIILVCSACGKPLVDVWVAHPEQRYNGAVKAECCYCGDHSFQHSVSGSFKANGIVKVVNEATGDAVFETKIVDVRSMVQDDMTLTTFYVKKA